MAGSVALMRLLDASLVASVAHGAVVFDSSGGVAAWCRLNRISRATFYRHRDRVLTAGAWVPGSRAPRRSPNRTPQVIIDAVLALRSGLGVDNGAVTIGYYLARDPALAGMSIPCPATIHKILTRHGLVVATPKKRPKSSWRRFAYTWPRDCYQIDATIVTLAGQGKVVVFEVLDDATRTLVATHAAPAETSSAAITAIRTAFNTFGVPAIVLSDNGSAFTSRYTGGGTSQFTKVVTAAGARLIHSSPYHPQTCGKVERHHRTFKAWLGAQPAPQSLPQLQRLCDTYQHWYNTTRPHTATHGPPLTAWRDAAQHGGPQHLPVQQDATVQRRTVNAVGVIRTGPFTISVGTRRAGQVLTVIRDGNHVTAYDPAGKPIGHLTINPDKNHQGPLTPAA